MPDFVYPRDDYDRPAYLKRLLGSFWANVFEDQASLDGLIAGRVLLQRQIINDLEELEAAMSRFTVPTIHKERWALLTLKLSEMNAEAAVLRYGDDAVFGYQPDGVSYRYGEPAEQQNYTFPLPPGILANGLLCNRLTEPSRLLVSGVDYLIEPARGTITFRSNPFADDLIPQRNLYDGTDVGDREIGLWQVDVSYDQSLVHRHFGYVLGLGPGRPDLGYRELVNAFFDAVVEGTSLSSLRAALSACTGIPCVLESGEVVELVTDDARGRLIATDRHVYRFPATATPIVSTGDSLRAGQALVSTVELIEFHRGECPDDLLALSLGKGFLANGYVADLVFENKDVPLVVETVDGYTKISFALGGMSVDVEKFFDDLHAKGVAADSTLAMLLDRRTNKTGQPTAGALPTTINPLKFLIANVLRENVALVRIQGELGEHALGLQYLHGLRKLVPPHTALLTLVELVADTDVITMDGPGDEETTGYTETPELFNMFESDGDELDSDSLTEEPTLFYVSDRCL